MMGTVPLSLASGTLDSLIMGACQSAISPHLPPRFAASCVFCGSSTGRVPEHGEAARALGELLARRGLGLVCGGGNVGLMGIVADATLAAGGEVIGVIPQPLVDRELAHRGVTRLEVVPTMHARKQRMHDLSEAFVALLGGLGTMDELFETLTWAQLGVHDKPCGLLDVAGFYDSLLALLDRMVTDRLLRPEHRALVVTAGTPAALLDRLAGYRPPRVRKWIAPGEE